MLFVVGGAPGAGKTAIIGRVRERLAGVVVLDMDEFLGPGSALAGVDLRYAAASWPAHNELCLALVAAVIESGVDCLLLTPLEPREVDGVRTRPRLGEIAWTVLDCADGVRRERLVARAMDEAGIRGAIEYARRLRALGLPVLDSGGPVTETAAAVTDWITRARR